LFLFVFLSPADLAVQVIRNYLQENPDASAGDVLDLVSNPKMVSDLEAHDMIHSFMRAAITPRFVVENKDITKYAPVVLAITKGSKIMERHLISSVELVNMDKPKCFPLMIQQFYSENALDEDTILEWAQDGRSEYTLAVVDEERRVVFRREAEPVLAWLQDANAEEDSDDED
jgi:translation initiation factor 5